MRDEELPLDLSSSIEQPHLPTPAEVAAARSPKGGWTKAQLAAWGVPWPPPKGWRRRLADEHELRAMRQRLSGH